MGGAKLLVTWVYLWITMSWKEENQSCKMTLQGLSGLFTECKVCLVSVLMPNADLCPLHSSLLQVQHFCKCFNIIGKFVQVSHAAKCKDFYATASITHAVSMHNNFLKTLNAQNYFTHFLLIFINALS